MLQIKDAGMNIASINIEEMDLNNEFIRECSIFLCNELLQIAGTSCKIIKRKRVGSYLAERNSSWRKRCG